MTQNSNYHNILDSVEKYIRCEKYRGYDPFDALSSPLFKLPLFCSNKTIRFGIQQVFKRIPFNLRPDLGIKKEINPVTIGLCIQSFSYVTKIYPEKKEQYLSEINRLLDILVSLSSKGYCGYCWGYNFDWESRYSKIARFLPTVVATGIITNGLFEYFKISQDLRIKELLTSSARFVLEDLNRSYEGDSFCFSYSPVDKQNVYNATMKGARLLTQVYSITNNAEYVNHAEQTVKYVINNQNLNGSWYYSKGDSRNWIDNFHTAYILDSLSEFISFSGLNQYKVHLDSGLDYYLKNLFTKDGKPKYYSNSFYPIDSTEIAQSIFTLTKFNRFEEAESVIRFGLDTLYSGKGYFYYQKRFLLNKISYMRWSNAWFYLALSYYLYRRANDLV
ncbi:MAG: delta-aminolevulinic acid dehydratase [Bacteroidales bacterium]|nr:delta-aminolevulinic acid dehydratase [Bacteroidales bacterium]